MAKLIKTITELGTQIIESIDDFKNLVNCSYKNNKYKIAEYRYIEPFHTLFVTETSAPDHAAMIVNILVSGRTEGAVTASDDFNAARICSARRNTWLHNLKGNKPFITSAVFFPNMSSDANLINPINKLTDYYYFKEDFDKFKENSDKLGFKGVMKNLLDNLLNKVNSKGNSNLTVKDCIKSIEKKKDDFKPNYGEDKVIKSFAGLPSSEFVYYPEFSNDDSDVCDFLMLVKGYGFIIFEVKGWGGKITYNKNKFHCGGQHGNPAKQTERYKKVLSEILKDNVFFTDKDIDDHIRCVCAFPNIGKEHEMANRNSTDYNLYQHCRQNGVRPLFKEDLADPKLADWLKDLFNKADLTGTQYENCRRILEPGYDNLSAAEGDYSHLHIWDKPLSYDDISYAINAWCHGTKQIHFVRNENDIKSIKDRLKNRMEELGIAPDGAYLKHGEVGKEAFNKNYISVFRFEAYVLPEGVNTGEFKVVNAKVVNASDEDINASIKDLIDNGIKDKQIENPKDGIFNLEQYLVEHEQADVNIAVTAGAGTGKTQTMASRIMYLCYEDSDSGVKRPSEDIVLITYTNEAADEMRSRLKKMFHSQYLLTRDLRFLRYSEDTENMHIGTIHSFIKKIIQNTSTALGVGSDYNVNKSLYRYKKILSEEIDKYAPDVWKGYYKSSVVDAIAGIGKKVMESGADISADTRNIDADKNPANIDEWLHDYLFLVLRDSYNEYRKQVRENNGVLLDEYADAFRECVNSPSFSPALFGFKYLFIDEFQDTDIYQVDGFAALINKLETARLFIVGDLKQSIYQFRGANGNSFTRIKKGKADSATDPKSWREHKLSLNYRSGKDLIDIFNAYTNNVYNSTNVSIYKDCELQSANNITSSYEEHKGENKEDVINALISKLNGNKALCKDTAILVRTNDQVNDVIRAAEAAGLTIKAAKNKSDDFYNHTAAIDLYFLLSALTHPEQSEYLYLLLYSNYMRVGIAKNNNTPLFSAQNTGLQSNVTEDERRYYSDNYNAFYPNYAGTEDKAEKLKQTINECIKHMIERNSSAKYWEELSDSKADDYWKEICTQVSNQGEAVSVLKLIYNLYMICEPFRITADPEGYKNDFNILLDSIASEFKDTQLTLDNLYESIKLKVQTSQPLNNIPDTENSNNDITCMTVHKAKGRQFKNVFVLLFLEGDNSSYAYTDVNVDANMITEVSGKIKLTKINPDNDNNEPGKVLFSFSFTFGKDNNSDFNNNRANIENENIFYVALTRAEENLRVYYSEYTDYTTQTPIHNSLVDYL